MKHLFVNFEIALKLKELGFDEECLACYPLRINPNLHILLIGDTEVIENVTHWQRLVYSFKT